MSSTSIDQRPVLFHLITGFQLGGAERMLERVLPRLTEFRHVVLSLTTTGPQESAYRRVGLETVVLGYSNPFNIFAFLRFARAVRQYRPRVLTTYLVHADAVGRIWGKLAGIPAIVSSFRARFRGQQYTWLLRFSKVFDSLVDAYLANSEEVQRYYMQRWHLPPAKFTVVTNGLDPSLYNTAFTQDKRQVMLREMRIPESSVIVGTVSQLRPEKKVERLIRAWPWVLRVVPQAHCVIIGDGALREFLEKLVADLGIQEHAHFVGQKRRIADVLPVFSVFTLPSAYEGMSNATLEAMACGLPSVVSDTPENREVIDPTVGMLTQTQNERMYAAALITLLQQPDLRQKLGVAARQKIKREFSLFEKVEQLRKFYWTNVNSHAE